MKVYRLHYEHDDSGMNYQWFSSRAKAERWFKRYRGAIDSPDYNDAVSGWGVTPVIIPLTRAALLAWLNSNIVLDNG